MSLREFIQEEAATEELSRIERERPLRQAEEALQRNARELATLEKERLRSSQDNEFRIDDAVKDAKLSISDAASYNASQASLFVQTTPDYYPSDGNQEILTDYLFRNGCQIANAATFTQAFKRLHSYGLLEDWPGPEQEPDSEPLPIIIDLDQPAPQPIQRLWEGWDISNGQPRSYSQFEIDRMPSHEFRIAMRIPTIVKNTEGSR